jgi:sarcosine oxidase gamma subunit
MQLQAHVDARNDGCVIDQTGGLLVLRAKGERIGELLARVGGHGALPTLGEARRSRMAEIPVLAIQVQADETLLVVERVYAEHLMNWLRVNAADVEDS